MPTIEELVRDERWGEDWNFRYCRAQQRWVVLGRVHTERGLISYPFIVSGDTIIAAATAALEGRDA